MLKRTSRAWSRLHCFKPRHLASKSVAGEAKATPVRWIMDDVDLPPFIGSVHPEVSRRDINVPNGNLQPDHCTNTTDQGLPNPCIEGYRSGNGVPIVVKHVNGMITAKGDRRTIHSCLGGMRNAISRAGTGDYIGKIQTMP